MFEQEKEGGGRGGGGKARRYAPHKIIPFIITIFTICSVSNIKTIIKEDVLARTRRDNGRHYARIAQSQRHFYGRLFFTIPASLRTRLIRDRIRPSQTVSQTAYITLHIRCTYIVNQLFSRSNFYSLCQMRRKRGFLKKSFFRSRIS